MPNLMGPGGEIPQETVAGWGDSFQDLRVGSCLTLRNELSKETHVLTKQKTLLGRDTQAETSRVRETRRTTLPRGLQSPVYGNGVSFWVVSGQSSCLYHIWSDSASFLVAHKSLSQDGFQHRGFWEVGRTYYGLASPSPFWPFLNSSSWR